MAHAGQFHWWKWKQFLCAAIALAVADVICIHYNVEFVCAEGIAMKFRNNIFGKRKTFFMWWIFASTEESEIYVWEGHHNLHYPKKKLHFKFSTTELLIRNFSAFTLNCNRQSCKMKVWRRKKVVNQREKIVAYLIGSSATIRKELLYCSSSSSISKYIVQ